MWKKEMYTRAYNIYNIKRAEKSQAPIEEICFTSPPRKLTSGLHIYILITVVGGQPTKPFQFWIDIHMQSVGGVLVLIVSHL